MIRRGHGNGALLIVAGAVALCGGLPAAAQPIDLIVNGEALVRLGPGGSIAAFNAAMQSQTIESLPSRQIYNVQILNGQNPETWKNAAEQQPNVLWVELNYFGQAPEARGQCFYGVTTPLPESYLNQPAWAQIDLAGAQTKSTGTGTVVAVVDTGVDATHAALAGKVLNTGWNFVESNANTDDLGDGVDNDNDGRVDEMAGHGTHVAGLVARVAPNAMILPIRVCDGEGYSTNFRVAQGMFYGIDHDADVLNVSIGSTYNSQAVIDAIGEATQNGITVVAAGGNMNTRLPVEYPALNAGVLGVASVDSGDVKTYFSNWHENFSISGPGLGIVSAIPGNLYAAWDGSSMSAPIISGTAALIVARHPEWLRDAARVANVRIAMMDSAVNVDPQNPQYAGQLGVGRLDANDALSARELLAAAVNYPSGPNPESVATADVDGDTRADLIVANAGGNTVSVLHGDGQGGFLSAVPYTVGAGPVGIAAADLDGDGDIDLAVACNDAGAVVLLRNNGNGTFSAATSIVSGGAPSGIAAADLVDTTLIDLVICDEDTDQVRVLRNTGGGNFTQHVALPAGEKPVGVALANVDTDGDLDIVAVNRHSNSISVFKNNGGGAFSSANTYFVGGDPRGLALGDFDGDGRVDVATANHADSSVTIAWNNGSGAFASTQTLLIGDGRRPDYVAAGDLDCDGHADLVATSGELAVNTATLFVSRTGRTFLRGIDYTVDAGPAGVLVADLDGDSDADVAVANAGGTTVSVLRNIGCDRARLGDMDCDGDVDFFDIDPFVLALNGQATYNAAYPDCDWLHADADEDGDVDFFDIDPFVMLLGG